MKPQKKKLKNFEKRFTEWAKSPDEDVEFLVSGTKSYQEFKEELTKVKCGRDLGKKI